MAGTQVVIDLANSPSFEDKAVLEFFETSGRNLLAAEAAAGVRHGIRAIVAQMLACRGDAPRRRSARRPASLAWQT